LTAKERFSSADARISDILATTLRAANWPIDPPPVLLLSKEGYWNQPQFGLVFAPAAEDSTLLGLPDLAHEVGHLLLAANERELLMQLQVFVKDALAAAGPVGLAPGDMDRRNAAWVRAWTVEFAADVIAAYLVGPAYLWQHLRLGIQRGLEPYQPLLALSTHPAPCARFDCSATSLSDLGADLTSVKEAWRELSLRGRAAPTSYGAVYPDRVLSALAGEVVGACDARGIRSFQEAPTDGLVAVMNEAWTRFSGADDIRAWDIAALARVLPRPKP
jgi:hypothetical protein